VEIACEAYEGTLDVLEHNEVVKRRYGMRRFVLLRRVLADHLLTGGLGAEEFAREAGGRVEVAGAEADIADTVEGDHTAGPQAVCDS
jgi:hypothetical protein